MKKKKTKHLISDLKELLDKEILSTNKMTREALSARRYYEADRHEVEAATYRWILMQIETYEDTGKFT